MPILPSDLPIQIVSEYLTRSIRSNQHSLRQGQIVKNLSRVEVVNVRLVFRLTKASIQTLSTYT